MKTSFIRNNSCIYIYENVCITFTYVLYTTTTTHRLPTEIAFYRRARNFVYTFYISENYKFLRSENDLDRSVQINI